MQNLNIEKIRQNKNTDFGSLYKKLLSNEHLSLPQFQFLLKLSVLFLNQNDLMTKKLGYRILLKYVISEKNYRPLYDYAVNMGAIHLAKQLENNYLAKNSTFLQLFTKAYEDLYKIKGIYYSEEQKALQDFYKTSHGDIAIVAPTSYGKSSMMLDKIESSQHNRICIIVPSKALLTQTKHRLLNNPSIAQKFQRILTHPEMYMGTETKFLAVLTQERLQALFKKDEQFSLDLIIIDEAHNLFSDDERAILLSQVLLLARKRNLKTEFNYLSPFIADIENLRPRFGSSKISSKKITEDIKSEYYYLYNVNDKKSLQLYDQFIDDLITISSPRLSGFNFIETYKGQKNLIYLNRPKDIEHFVSNFTAKRPLLHNIQESKEYKAIASYIHKDYKLLNALQHGIAYHHGAMPDIIKLYVENIFSNNNTIEYIVTSSTLLEGVNIPADTMFILSPKKGRRSLTSSQFRNLTGRVCRFSEIFKPKQKTLELLMPSIFLIVSSDFCAKNFNPLSFIKKMTKHAIPLKDSVENVLLQQCSLSTTKSHKKLQEIIEYTENLEPGIIPTSAVQYIQSKIGKLCYKHNVKDFNIRENEAQLLKNMSSINLSQITQVDEVIENIYNIFLHQINITNPALQRLQQEKTRAFYKMLLNWWIQGTSYGEMISSFIAYWKNRSDKLIYVGPKWGEIKRTNDEKQPLHIDISNKSNYDLVNIAIIKIKEEEDFLDFNLMKYIEILHDLTLLSDKFYEHLKYGSNDTNIITMLKNGFSIELAKLLNIMPYKKYVNINQQTQSVILSPNLINEMKKNEVNDILVFETQFHTGKNS